MTKKLTFLCCVLFGSTCFGQQTITRVQVVDMYGNVQNYNIRTFDPNPQTLEIRPYGLNLKPANVPARQHRFVPYDRPVAPPIEIENPFYVEPKPSFWQSFGSWIASSL